MIIEGTVEAVDALVGEVMVTLQLSSGQSLTALVEGMDDTAFVEGSAMRLSVDAGQVRVFDPNTEQALTPDEE